METASLLNHGDDQTKRSTYLHATAVTLVSSLNVHWGCQLFSRLVIILRIIFGYQNAILMQTEAKRF